MALTHLVETSAIVDPPTTAFGSDARFATSIICIGELHAALLMAESTAARSERMARLTRAASGLVVLDVDQSTAAAYGALRTATGRGPSNDLWIAATAKVHGLVLVTRDRRLARLPGVETLLA